MDDILNISIVKIYRKEHGITSFNSKKTEFNSDQPPLKSNNDKDKDTPCFQTVLLLPLWTLPPGTSTQIYQSSAVCYGILDDMRIYPKVQI